MPTNRFIIEEGPPGTGYTPRGAALDLWRYKGGEVVLAGPAETGKTRACLEKLDGLLWKYAGSQAVVVRKVRATMPGSVLSTYRRKVLRDDSPVTAHGGESPQHFTYPNGSRLWVAGMDDPGKALSSERDFVYVNQTEELTLDDWQVLVTRATGRAGNAPYAQVMGDCNPGPPHHWLLARHDHGRGPLKLLESRHQDNPVLWNGHDWTEQGRRTLAVLDGLTGVRKERLRYGRWVSAEGVVYEGFDPRLHVVEPFPVPRDWTRFRSVDFGFAHPFVCQFWALDPDGRMYLYRELYMTGRTVADHAARINALSAGERFEVTVADHDREDRETLHQAGIVTVPAVKDVSTGIQAVADRLKSAGDGRPRLFLVRGCLVERDEGRAAAHRPCCTRDEFDAYSWPRAHDGRPVKDAPVKVDDDGMDALRYAVMWANQRGRVGAGGIGTPKQKSVFAGGESSAGPSPFGERRPKGGW